MLIYKTTFVMTIILQDSDLESVVLQPTEYLVFIIYTVLNNLFLKY